MQDQYDVLIVGAGLSGVGMGCHLTRECPGKRFAILERRDAIGGTWDLFRYPGIRSDSDMFTFGYEFRPWNDYQVLADGTSIRQYVTDTAQEYGVDRRIQFGLKITRAEWSSEQNLWTVTALHEASGGERQFRTRFLISCTGYYNYDQGYLPDFPGMEHYRGLRVHPQQWPEGLDYRGKRVVVIGSGATAVTLVPAMAETAAQVTMLQRSPTYIFSIPGIDKISKLLSRVLPDRWVYAMARKRNIVLLRWMYFGARRYPESARRLLLGGVRKQLGADGDMRDFTPRYQPWDQRLCAVPSGDLFRAIRAGRAAVVTDEIETFTATGLKLKSGRTLDADIIITATGLNLQVFGGVEVRVDGQPRRAGELMTYKGTLLQDVPNLGWIMGYANAPWTLKADIAARYLCRLITQMDARGYRRCVARAPAGERQDESILGALSSGYVARASAELPRQGRELPWRVLHDYRRDRPMLLKGPIEDGALEFSRGDAAGARLQPSVAAVV